MAAGGWFDWSTGDLVTEARFQDIQDSIVFIFASESAANSALTNKVEGTVFYDTGANLLKAWSGSAWIGAESGDIEGITTSSTSGMAGGATSGTPSLSVKPNSATAGTVATGDEILFGDINDSNNLKKTTAGDIAALSTSGLSLVTSGSVTGVTGITLDNVFTTSFTNYLFQFNGTGVSDSYVEQIRLQFRASGSTNSDSDSSFVAMLPFKQGSSQTGVESDIDQSYFQLIGNWVDNEKFAAQVTILEPQVSGQSTSIMYQTGNRYNEGTESYATHNGTGIKEGTGSFDGLYFFVDGSQTITGNYRLYGYK